MEQIMQAIAIVVSIAFFAAFVYVMVRGIMSWHSNKDVPVVTSEATVAGKRNGAAHDGKNNRNEFFVSFKTDVDDPVELSVTRLEYSQVSVGDKGMLSHRAGTLLRFEITEKMPEGDEDDA